MKKTMLAFAIMAIGISGANAQSNDAATAPPNKIEPAVKKMHCKESSGELKKVNSRLDPKILSEDGSFVGNASVLSVGGGSFSGAAKR